MESLSARERLARRLRQHLSRAGSASLSLPQQRLWLLETLDPGGAAYHVPLGYRLVGEPAIHALDQALDEIPRRHGVLRARFEVTDGKPRQHFAEPCRLHLPRIDLSGLTAVDRSTAAGALGRAVARRPFNLERGPLARTALLRLGPEHHDLRWTVHHLVFDAWSTGIVSRELEALYGAFRDGRPSPLAEPDAQYGEFVRWQSRQGATEEAHRRLEESVERLRETLYGTELPTDRPRPSRPSGRGEFVSVDLPSPLLRAVEALAREHASTPFTVLLTAFLAFLARQARDERPTIGFPVAHRSRAEWTSLVGFFTNTLVLRGDLQGDPTFADALDRIGRDVRALLATQEVPFDRLVERLRPDRSSGRNPLFQVLFSYRVGEEHLELPGLRVSTEGGDTGTAKFDLSLSVSRGRRRLTGRWEYSTDLFDRTTVLRFARRWHRWLEDAVDDPARPLSDLGRLDAPLLHQIIREWNDTGRSGSGPDPGPMLPALLAEHARRRPDAVAVVGDEAVLTHGALDRLAGHLAARLCRRGIGPESVVGVLAPRGLGRVVALLGVWKSGAAFLPLDPGFPAARLALLLEDAGAFLVVTAEGGRNLLPEGIEGVDAFRGGEEDEYAAVEAPSPDAAAYVIYTSGSTGRPKGVVLGHRGLPGLTRAQRALGLGPDDRVLQLASPSFDAAVFELVMALGHGGTLVVAGGSPPPVGEELRALMARERVTATVLPPSVLATVPPEAETSAGDLGALRSLSVAGEACPPELVRRFGADRSFFNLYGPTEVTIWGSGTRLRPGEEPHIGRATAEDRAYVLDDDLHPLSPGTPGQLFLGGAGIARGYLGHPGRTAAVFVPDPFADPESPGGRLYATGDLARWRSDGTLDFLGRIDRQVKLRGFRIEPGEVTATLASHPGVRTAEVVVAGEPHPELIAFAVPEGAVTDVELLSWLGERLPAYLVPSRVVGLDDLPRRPSGKVDADALLELAGPRPTTRDEARPRGPVEEALAEIFAEVLGLPAVGIRDSFFELGGHSLLAARLAGRVRAVLATDLPLRTLFENPTVESLASALEPPTEETGGALAPRPDPTAPAPTSHAQERLWFLDRLDPGSSTYNVAAPTALDGPLSPTALTVALGEVVRRHQVLRTVFDEVEGRPFQHVLDPPPSTLPMVDLSGLAEKDREAAARRLTGADGARPFDLACGPMFRARLLRLAAERHVYLPTVHHVAADGWAVALLQQETTAHYRRVLAGTPFDLAEPTIQYADFAAWQRRVQDTAMAEPLAQRVERLTPVPEPYDPPMARPRSGHQTYRGARRTVHLDAETSQALRALGNRLGATLYMTLLSLFSLWWTRYLGREELTVGSPVAGRDRREVEDLVGCFLNTLVLRVDLAGGPTFAELVRRVREEALDAFAARQVPVELLLDRLQPERDLSRNALFQVLFNLLNLPSADLDLPGVSARSLALPEVPSKFDLTLYAVDADHEVELHLVFNADLFEDAWMDALAESLGALARAVTADPERPVGSYSLATGTALPDPEAPLAAIGREPIPAAFRRRLAEDPDAPVMEDVTGIWSRRELADHADALRADLVAVGVGRGDLVAVRLPRSGLLTATLLSTLEVGAAFWVIDPDEPMARLASALTVVSPKAWVDATPPPPGLPPSCAVLAPPTVHVDDASPDPQEPPTSITADDLAYVAFTSGTTGRPRGVAGEHGPVSHYLTWQGRTLGLGPGDRVAMVSALGHDPLLRDVFGPLAWGAVSCAPDTEREDPAALARWLRDRAVTVLHATPALLRWIVDALADAADRDDDATLPDLRHVLSSGEALPWSLVADLRRIAPEARVINLYGATETPQGMGWRRADLPAGPVPTGTVPVGRGIDGVQLLVLRSDDSAAGVGESGEIHVRTPHLARGYVGEPALTAERFRDAGSLGERLYATGDLGYYLPDGSVALVGRRDRQLQVRGFRLEPGEVEAALTTHPAVAEAAVDLRAPAEPPGAAPLLTAWWVPAGDGRGPGGTPGDEALRTHLQDRLPSYAVPALYERLDALPRNARGKVDPAALPAPRLPTGDDPTAPESSEERLLAEVFARVLGLPTVATGDHFFALGGHSLKATQVVSRVRSATGIELPVRALFEEPTVAGLARRLRAARVTESTPLPPVTPRPEITDIPLTYAQERLWFLDQLDSANTASLINAAFVVDGPLHARALTQGLGMLSARHEALRTTFRSRDGRAVQVVHPWRPAPLSLVDLSRLTPGDAEGQAAGIVDATTRRGLDLDALPLWRATLVRTDRRHHRFILNLHHIVADGWSLGVLSRELRRGTEHALAGTPDPTPPLPVQVPDYALWQRRFLDEAALERGFSYWRARLVDRPPALDLPTDRPYPAHPDSRGDRRSLRLPDSLVTDLEAAARNAGATLFMLLLSGFEALLHRHSGQDRFLVGTPVAHRDREEIEDLIGIFFNLLVLDAELAGAPDFEQLLWRVRRTALGAFAHQDVPFERLLEALQPERQTRRAPLFQVVFALQNASEEPLRLPGAEVRVLDSGHPAANFDLTLFLRRSHQGGLWATAEYRSCLFDPTTVERFLRQYVRLLTAAAAEPRTPVSRLPLLSGAERHQVLREWNDTAAPIEATTLPALVAQSVRRNPNTTAVLCSGRRRTYAEVEDDATRLARTLLDRGLRPGGFVALLLDRGAAMVQATYGVLKTGAAYVPLELRYPPARVAYILDTLDIRHVVVDAAGRRALREVTPEPADEPIEVFHLGEPDGAEANDTEQAPAGPWRFHGPEVIDAASAESFDSPTRPGDLAYVIFTSGSTGHPKGVMERHRPAVNLLAALDGLGVEAGDRLLFVTSLCFDLSVYDLFGTLAAGATVRIATRDEAADPQRLACILLDEPITFWDSAPAALQQVVPFLPREAPDPAPALRRVFLSGDWIPVGLPDRLRRTFPGARVISLGGATEATVWSNTFPVDRVEPHWLSIPYGRPIDNARYHVLDEHLEPTPVGVAGDLYIAGPCLSTGYAARPRRTALQYLPDPHGPAGSRLYATGDRARHWADGVLEFLGRLDHQVKVRGFRVELGEIESVLESDPRVRRAVVLAREDQPGDQRLVAYVTAVDTGPPKSDDSVERWSLVYDETYRREDDGSDEVDDLDTAGWQSSYTGEPYPAEQMLEWTEGTVRRILGLAPRRLLELGSGTGLLLLRVAPGIERYVGTDISRVSLDRLGRAVAARGLTGVELHLTGADDAAALAALAPDDAPFDTVVCNSVSQHFPDAGYLARVVTGAVTAVGRRGRVMIGDVRSLPHLAAFHASLALHRLEDSVTQQAFAATVRDAVRREEELVVDPKLFEALGHHLPTVGRVEVQIQRGRHHHEMSRFRFTAVLTVGAPPEKTNEPTPLDWTRDGISTEALRRRLATDPTRHLTVFGIPNARLWREEAALRWMDDEEDPARTLGALRRRLTEHPAETVDPEDLWALEDELPVRVALRWGTAVGEMVATVTPAGSTALPAVRELPKASAGPPPDWEDLTNRPYLQRLRETLAAELRGVAGHRLPDYMVPSAVVVLDEMPVTPNGKVDRKALPAPTLVRSQHPTEDRERSELEDTLATVWAEVLGIDDLGLHEDFFELGGHSLLATQVVARLRNALGVDVSLRTLFESQTVAGLAVAVEELRVATDASVGTAATPTAPTDRPLPLSFAQQRLWFLDQLAPDSRLYRVPLTARLDGTPSLPALARAVTELVHRQEALRTTFGEDDGVPHLVIHDPGPATPLPVVDLRGLAADEREARAAAVRRAFEDTPFDLAAGPLFRAALVRLAETRWVLHLGLHHVISDGWSIGVLLRDLADGYRSLVAGDPAERPPLPRRFADYAWDERQRLQGDTLDRELAYWHEALGDPPPLELPTDRPRSTEPGYRAARHLFDVPAALADRLEALAREHDATLFMVLAAAFTAWLARTANQERFAFGTPVAHRTRSEWEPLVGFFVNTLALSVDTAGDPLFSAHLARVRDSALGAFQHQDVPLEKLLDELQPERDLSRSPLFQVLFVLQNAPLERVDFPGLELIPVRMEPRASNFDVSLSFTRREDRLAGGWIYDRDLFDPATAARGARQLTVLLTGLIETPHTPLSELPLLTAAERHQLAVEWNAPQVDFAGDPCLHHLFEARAATTPDRVAVVGPRDEQISYGALAARARAVARALQARGVGPEVRVGLHADRAPERIVALLGILLAGGVFVPLDPEVPARRRAVVADDAAPSLVLHVGTDDPAPGEVTLETLLAEDPGERTPLRRDVGPDHLAYVLHTSGSTGRPKGVMIPHRGIARRIAFAEPGGHVSPGERFLHKASLGFDVSLLEIFIPLASGGATVLAPPARHTDPSVLVEVIRRHQVTQAVFPPSLLHSLLDEPGFTHCRSLEGVVSSAEALPAALRERVCRLLDADFYNRYGPTEASVAVSSHRCDPSSTEPSVPIGRPIANADLHLVDRRLRRVAVGVPGELLVGGRGLARGYLGRPARTAVTFLPHPFAERPGERVYRTGDRVRWRTDGRLEFLGRIDSQVQVRGVRVEPGEVTAVLLEHRGVERAVVDFRPDEAGGGSLVAYVVLSGPPVTAAELRGHVATRLPDAFVPSAFVFLEALPMLPSGKVDRKALPDPAATLGTVAQVTYGSELERAVAAVWSDVLGLERVAADENFFDLGGHSLLLLQVRGRLRTELGREVAVIDLFRYPTVRALTRFLEPGSVTDPTPIPSPNPITTPPRAGYEPIAVIGMAGRFPGAGDIEELWSNLCAGRESISFFTDEELTAAGVDPERRRDPRFVPAGGILEGADRFDAEFFRISPREAELLDPQHRVFLETAWAALEDAAYDPATHDGRIGVFAGSGWNTYLLRILQSPETARRVGGYQVLLGSDKDFLTTRVAYKLGLRGPCLSVQTACSTALVATHLACRSLQTGDCDMALAGGVSVAFPQHGGYRYEPGMILSPDGHCRAFDAEAGGTVRGNGVGLVVLKRLSDALTDGDRVAAVIRGSAVNNDADDRVGYTAPGVAGQAAVITRALEAAEVDPATIGYVEAHGTGTALGDPIEVAALRQAFDNGSNGNGLADRRIVLGSVKTNLGHLNTAAGVVGLIKASLTLERERIPPSLHFERPNPQIPFADGPFRVARELTPWPARADSPRRAAVSSFGIGGTNAHVILEEAPPAAPAPTEDQEPRLLIVSARTETALDAATARLAGYLEGHPRAALGDVAFTLQVGRRAFEHRRAVVADNPAAAVETLRDPRSRDRFTARAGSDPRPVAFLFPGQGSQHVGMGRELYEREPAYRAALGRCATFLDGLGVPLLELLYPKTVTTEAVARLTETRHAQPALFAVEWALAELWRSRGLEPAAVAGHSLGEYVAAAVAGVFSMEDALDLVVERGRLMQQQPTGSMLAVALPEAALADRLPEDVSMAAVNGPADVVLSGPSERLEALAAELTADGAEVRPLHTSHAFHSSAMEPVVEPLATRVAAVRRRAPDVPWVSAVTGEWATPEAARDPRAWGEQALRPVRFGAVLERLDELGEPLLLEVGPGRALATLARRRPERPVDLPAVTSLPHPKRVPKPGDEVTHFLGAFGRLWAAGAEVRWAEAHAGSSRRRVSLPTYPFEGDRHWIGDDRVPAGTAAGPASLTESVSSETLFTDSLEAKIAALWRDLLGVERVGTADDFFSLGGSSLLAVRLNARLAELTGIEVGPHLLLEAPTVAELATAVRAARNVDDGREATTTVPDHRPTCWVPIRPGGDRTPLVLVHPAGGHVYFYRELASGLDPRRPVYGLRALGLEAGETPHEGVEVMAACYVEALNEMLPDTAVILGGSSMGGTIAYEMAHQLRRVGRQVDRLLLLDTPGPGQMPVALEDDAAILTYLYGARLGVTDNELRPLSSEEQLGRVLEAGRRLGLLPEDVDTPRLGRLLALFKAHMKALRDYRPPTYDGALSFFRARTRRPGDPPRPELAWIPHATGDFDLRPVPGDHISMHHEPNLAELIRQVRRATAGI